MRARRARKIAEGASGDLEFHPTLLPLTWHFREIKNAAPKDLESRGFPDTQRHSLF